MIAINENLGEPPLCKDCEFLIPFPCADATQRLALARCKRSKTKVDLITGARSHTFCETERTTESGCGPGGKYFQQSNADVMP